MRSLGLTILALVGAAAMVCPQARADEWNKKTVVTFNQPVEIPGIVLPAGTYVFKLADTMADRNVVQVFNKNENRLYGTFLAIPDYRMKTPDKAIITFEERAAGSPEAVKAWFYPGDNYGDEFVYPKARAVELAHVTHQAVPSMPSELAANTKKPAKTMKEAPVMAMKQSHLTVQSPGGEESEVAQAFPPRPVETASARIPKRLPKTGSPLPLIGLIGLISLGGGWSLRVAARRNG
jgi:LPXTG-motif cell wall-anchored protein